MSSKQAKHQKIPEHEASHSRLISILIVIGMSGLIGWALIQVSKAATYAVSLEVEAGQLLGNASVDGTDAGASGGRSVRFGGSVSTATPAFTATVLVQGLNKPWDIAWLPTGEFLFPQKSGSLSIYRNGATSKVADISDIMDVNETGLMGLAVDPQFTSNRYIYTCYGSQSHGDVRVARWKLNATLNGLTDRTDIITGIKASPIGRHAGCRVAFGPDGYLWTTTGDGQYAATPQDLHGLAGKVLRTDRNGAGAPDNLGGGADSRIFSYGHRNVEGIAFFPAAKNGVLGLSSEHGPTADDEVNELRKGNFGWASSADGADTGSMTDKARWPDAVSAIWSSGVPTQAPSGMTIVTGSKWKGWDGAVAVAILKAKHLKVLRLDAQNKVTKEEQVLVGTYGRLRTVQEGPDGNLYITTDNTTNDQIIRLTPQ